MEEFEGVFAYRLEKRYNGKVYSVAQGVTNRKSLDNYEKRLLVLKIYLNIT